jgi:hypothetical protein
LRRDPSRSLVSTRRGWHTEPVIKAIYRLISQDEARHGGASCASCAARSTVVARKPSVPSPRSEC